MKVKFFSTRNLLILSVLVVVSIFVYCYFNRKIDKFENNTKKPYTLILFYADWCKHCKDFKPEWEKLKVEMPDELESKIELSEYNVDDPESEELLQEFDVNFFPDIRLVNNSDRKDNKFFEGERKFENVVEWLQQNIK